MTMEMVKEAVKWVVEMSLDSEVRLFVASVNITRTLQQIRRLRHDNDIAAEIGGCLDTGTGTGTGADTDTSHTPSHRPTYPMCTVSAPGKALIAGGYLVTDAPHVGVVVAATSRFFSTIRTVAGTGTSGGGGGLLAIAVYSPQFHATYEYTFDCATGALSRTAGNENDFVERCLSLTLIFLTRRVGTVAVAAPGGIAIKLRADNDFYSQIHELQAKGMPLLSTSLAALPPFMPCPTADDGTLQVAKTGMGSSAALTTSLVGSLLHFYGAVDLSPTGAGAGAGAGAGTGAAAVEGKLLCHNLAQLAHAIAQGKVGSGFDVGAAVFGSIRYVRFQPALLQPCLDAATGVSATASGGAGRAFTDLLVASVLDRALWTQKTDVFALPPGCDMCMGDVCGGSSTTSMTRAVKKWLREGGLGAQTIWLSLADTNERIYEAFSQLTLASDAQDGAYMRTLSLLMATPSEDWLDFDAEGAEPKAVLELVTLWVCVRALLLESRRLLKVMGEGSGVDIEPDEQTKLADDTMTLPGVLAAGVPGAGGVDAIFALTLGPHARSAVEGLWAAWSKRTVCPLMLTAQGASDPSPGIRAETFLGWD